MANKRTIVEINGRKYDANTGQIVMDTPTASQVIDGFKPSSTNAAASQPMTSPLTAHSVVTSTSMHQKPQRTMKLHPAAAKNVVVPKRVLAKSAEVRRDAQRVLQETQIAPKTPPNREQRAALQTKSELVTKYGSQPEAIVAAPVPTPRQFSGQKPINDMAPAISRPMQRPISQARSASTTQQTENKQVREAIEEKIPKVKKGLFKELRTRRPKLIPATMTVVMILAVLGYFTYQNIPNMALRVAAQRAGFNATLPGYSPSGFSFSGPVAYSQGVVELAYTSNSDNRNFKLIQRESDWDSQSLLDNHVSELTSDYLTFQERGLTVYIYDVSNATWVDGGIWYTIEGDSNLSSEQLLKIAGSL